MSAIQPLTAKLESYRKLHVFQNRKAKLNDLLDGLLENASPDAFAQHAATFLRMRRPRIISTEDFLHDLRFHLLQRQAYWEKEAQKYARESESSNRAKRRNTTQGSGRMASGGKGDIAFGPQASDTENTSSTKPAALQLSTIVLRSQGRNPIKRQTQP